MYHYPLAIELGDEQHAFGVEVPDIPGCFSAGDTLDEAITQAHEAIGLHLEGLAEDGELPPQPQAIASYSTQARFVDRVWAVASIDAPPTWVRPKSLTSHCPACWPSRSMTLR